MRSIAEVDAVVKGATFVRVVVDLAPAGGDLSRVAPPTYADPKDVAVEWRVVGERAVKAVVLDSIGSQANRMELALLDRIRRGDVRLPVITVRVPGKSTEFTVYELPHRVFDAYVKTAGLGDTPFVYTPIGDAIYRAQPWEATAIYTYCPHVLVFGGWDSHLTKNTPNGAKFARVVTSEVVGVLAEDVPKDEESLHIAGGKTDPFRMPKDIGKTFYYTANEYQKTEGPITTDESKALKEKKDKKSEPVKVGGGDNRDKGRPSAVGFAAVAPSLKRGDVSVAFARQTAAVSCVQLRRLGFPDGEGKRSDDRDAAGRAVVFLLGLYALAAQIEDGYDLRARCHLVPRSVQAVRIGRTIDDQQHVDLDPVGLRDLLDKAVKRAEGAGLRFHPEEIVLDIDPSVRESVFLGGDEE